MNIMFFKKYIEFLKLIPDQLSNFVDDKEAEICIQFAEHAIINKDGDKFKKLAEQRYPELKAVFDSQDAKRREHIEHLHNRNVFLENL